MYFAYFFILKFQSDNPRKKCRRKLIKKNVLNPHILNFAKTVVISRLFKQNAIAFSRTKWPESLPLMAAQIRTPPYPLTPWVLSTAPSEKRAKPFLDKHPDKLQVKRAPEMQRNNETDEVHGLQRGALSAMS